MHSSKSLNRRDFGKAVAGFSVAAAAGSTFLSAAERKMTIDLVCGAIGVGANQVEAIDLASRYGFESVGADVGNLTRMSSAERKSVVALLKEKGLVFGAAGLPVEFRRDEEKFKADLSNLPAACQALQEVGVTRVGTWIMPNHATLTYRENFRLHLTRLKEVALILNDHGLRFGMEYVGPRTLWSSLRYSFIHTMAEANELIAEIRMPNVGLVLDSWHWYTAQETEADLLSLSNEDVVAVDLNDAPAGIEVAQQVDSKRRLPTATGVIDVATFLKALVKIGYDGPVRAEPFDATLREMEDEKAVAETAAAMKKAFSLIA
ncbi:MAG: sugar phosphate isomerase/epimerase [Acidobacteriota bacterium]|nr:MAG: sugar phosphate isomerase/epimerase [Acidobacteriota bacterium]